MMMVVCTENWIKARAVRFAFGTYSLNLRWDVSEHTMDEKRIARLFGLTLGGPFAVSLILSAITI